MDNTIELQGVSKSFGRFRAVDELSFNVPRGMVFGLLGPNGAGKTTTIRMIMNITAADSGEIRVLGNPMTRETQNRIGYLPEERGLYRKMKVLDHLLFLAAIKEVSREDARRRIGDWAEKLCDEICLLARSKKILEGNLRDLKRRFSKDVLHLAVDAEPSEIASLPGVATSQPVNGGYLVVLAPGMDQREFLRRTLERHP